MAVRPERHGALRIVRSPDGGNTSPFEERIADVLQMRGSKHRSRFRGAVEPSEERLSRREGCHRTAECMDRSTLDREHRNETIRRLAEAGSEASGVDDSRLRQAKKKLADAETRMRRLQLSIEAGVEPAAVADALNRALEEREAARADLDRVPTTNVLTEKKIAEIVDGLGNVAELLNSADPSELAALYAALRLEMVYNAAAKIVGVSIRPTGRGSDRVRGGCVSSRHR
jgi:hypothetical protein